MLQADAAGRELTVGGTFNVRDLGGLPIRGGGAVRRGLVYRSADLGGLTRAGADRLRALGLATVVDLRRAAEIERHGRFPFERHGIAYRHHPLLDTSTAEPEGRPVDLPADVLDQLYRRIAEEGGRNLGAVLSWLAEPGALPAVVHCVAGKDRTGTVVAVLLALLDVSDDEIAADYARSEAALASHRAWAEAHDERAAAWLDRIPPPLMAASRPVMLGFLGWLRERHGSAAAYAGSIGVGPDAVTALRARLVRPGR
jgi:protein-tyrosine phosphatase